MGVTRYWRYSKEKMLRLRKEGRIVQTKPGAVPRYKRYLDEVPGAPVTDVWTDIPPVQGRSREFLGYPTQKPVRLLERILEASTEKGAVVLDPFCGCGTTVVAAQRMKRRWVGIDITFLAIALMKHRLYGEFRLEESKHYQVIGEPVSVAEAQALAVRDRFQFQVWALGLVGARPRDPKRGRDYGIDGRVFFHDGPIEAPEMRTILVQVKSGRTGAKDIRDLRGTMEREGAAIAVLIALHEATTAMLEEAEKAGSYFSELYGKSYPRIQVLSVHELLEGTGKMEYPEQPRAWIPQKGGSSRKRYPSGGSSGGRGPGLVFEPHTDYEPR
jgi:hypothetical protein